MEPGATQTTSGDLSHPHSTITPTPAAHHRIKIRIGGRETLRLERAVHCTPIEGFSGHSGVKLKRVANHARLSKGSLYQCFYNRAELVGRAARHRYLVR